MPVTISNLVGLNVPRQRPQFEPLTREEGAGYGYVDKKDSDTNQQSTTFSNVDIGTPAPDRVIIIGISCTTNETMHLNYCRIDGNDMTKYSGANKSTGSGGNYTGGQIVSRLWPTGTTATIKVNWNTNGYDMFTRGLSIYAVRGLDNILAYDTGETQSSNDDKRSITLNTLEGGIVVASSGLNQSGKNVVWTGVSEDHDSDNEDSWSAGHAVNTKKEVLTVQADWNYSSAMCLVGASWR